MRFIDKEALMKSIQENPAVDGNHRAVQLLECIINAPTVDAVPVIRCRECSYHIPKCTICQFSGMTITENDFCSYGQRKESIHEVPEP